MKVYTHEVCPGIRKVRIPLHRRGCWMGLTDELVAFALDVDHRLITAAHPGRDAQAPHECANHHDREHGLLTGLALSVEIGDG